MATEAPAPAEQPPAPAERRSTAPGRRHADRNERLRSLAGALLALCGALSIIYFAIAAIGAVDLTEALAGSIIALVLAGLWLAGAWQRSRSNSGFATRSDRERRGF